ncbi:(E)-4-hydroxy-3-methylbut-2-enyl-diphosphate synthase [Deminuibacter soli]|uniref:4-hydroxy-3-methylbut-2-en-1-yl diphosphate synthase (flavodoxin) n=1 Tax=Deminuibacter soli TaxID=2291815 RepID=A0A3E1NPK6_9BACT|nr:(E)-4-hydroxy-3-methylbut-2-enyl-diphosphate synthase [Deminuibacter soli]RFM29866.1 4-hydroxy-3-methylbut-2-en-1-yl diphosphate synthase [Deminuibacter soli]
MQFYCNSLTAYNRFITREVKIGDLLLGNGHPIRLQTMTTTDTMDTLGTVEQTIRCIEAGAELVRITAPSKKEAENLQLIKQELHRRGYHVPLIADIHFTPNAAEIAARIVEKVRVNPGNYVDKKKFELLEYTDAAYTEEIERIRERFTPLVKICREYGTAMRIGTNHGSLSDRIMSRYGDTPMGMVESAMEFLRIARNESYHNIVLSMKASNPQVMVQAYRLLIQQMQQEFNECYPLHLGVTEAGDGEDGRIKSAIGIGSLLEDGIGDTIRVSLTEDPEFEIPVCKDLVKRYVHRKSHAPIEPLHETGGVIKLPYNPFEYKRRKTTEAGTIGAGHVPVVVADFMQKEAIVPADLTAIGYTYNEVTDKWNIGDGAADFIYTAGKQLDFALPGTLKIITDAAAWQHAADKSQCFPLFQGVEYLDAKEKSAVLNFIGIDVHAIDKAVEQKIFAAAAQDATAVFCFFSTNKHSMPDVRRTIVKLMEQGIHTPVILCVESHCTTADEQLIEFSAEAGSLFLDGMGDGIWLMNDPKKLNNVKVSGRNYIAIRNNHQFLNATAFSILQATRTRISKTEYISCPSCGRTLFDLQETTAKIRAVTNHLKGVKIAIMGCIVNGPGEMADADFGYVGSGVGKITLYRGKEVVKRNVESDVAVDELIDLLKESGAWIEPQPVMNNA